MSSQNTLKCKMRKDRFPSVAPAVKERKMTTLVIDESFGFFFQAFILSISLVLLALSLFCSCPPILIVSSLNALKIRLVSDHLLGAVSSAPNGTSEWTGRDGNGRKFENEREGKGESSDAMEGRVWGVIEGLGRKGTALKKFSYLFNPQSCLNI